jgi:hypothetical protein
MTQNLLNATSIGELANRQKRQETKVAYYI